jgi:hypothetical protein
MLPPSCAPRLEDKKPARLARRRNCEIPAME